MPNNKLSVEIGSLDKVEWRWLQMFKIKISAEEDSVVSIGGSNGIDTRAISTDSFLPGTLLPGKKHRFVFDNS